MMKLAPALQAGGGEEGFDEAADVLHRATGITVAAGVGVAELVVPLAAVVEAAVVPSVVVPAEAVAGGIR